MFVTPLFCGNSVETPGIEILLSVRGTRCFERGVVQFMKDDSAYSLFVVFGELISHI